MFFTRVLFQKWELRYVGSDVVKLYSNIFLIDRINKANETKIGVDR